MNRLRNKKVVNSLRSNTALDDQQIFNVAPSIFTNRPHEAMSERYISIPTFTILNLLKKEGFFPFFVAQSYSRQEGKSAFAKHMIRLRPKDSILAKDVGEIILINSHDGTSSYKMMSGVYRFVCQNGLIIGNTVTDYTIFHKGNVKQDILSAAYAIIGNFAKINIQIDRMRAVNLDYEEQEMFAKSALKLKYNQDSPIKPRELLQIRRNDDQGNDLWRTFNKVQENIIRGGLSGKANGRRIKTRKVVAIASNIKLNRALWNLADQMASSKLHQ
jgi:hypothetical protein